jgi:hypothetical protein
MPYNNYVETLTNVNQRFQKYYDKSHAFRIFQKRTAIKNGTILLVYVHRGSNRFCSGPLIMTLFNYI